MKINILWQNEHAVLIEKPALSLSVPGRMQQDGRPVVGWILQEQLQTNIFPVHRLDFEVSGVMIYALSKPAHAKLNQCFENREINKTYLAVTETAKQLPVGSQVWTRKILRGKKRAFESEHGLFSETWAEILKSGDPEVLWKLQPVTGRSHQLRLELYLQGFPIRGDTLYNSKVAWPHPGIALRAVKIEFPESVANEFGIPLCQDIAPWI